ncbi:MAG: MFS transporter, partial [Anaerolineales bacterium]|nr:MFS transporter [Anaerolineales bacterium]
MKRLRWYDYITINLYWLGLNIRNTSVGSVFTPYLIALFVPEGERNSALGFISTAGLMIAMLVQPAAGLLSDRSTSRFGRRRPFILVGSLFDIVFLAMIALSGNFAMLLVATLLIQFSANVSHGPLQGLIPDLVPPEQRGRASAVKAVMELIPIVLVGFTIAQLVGAGKLGWAVFAAGAVIFVVMLLTMLFVREEPLKEKPSVSFKIPMLRVLGMLAGIALGALAGLAGGGVVGGLIGLATWPFAGKATALAVMVGIGGVAAMVVAVAAGVWSGALATLGQDARRHASFTWWVVNRLFFLAAATSFQGFLPFFLMYAFGMSAEEAASANGTLMMVIGLLIIASALGSGWLSDRFGKRSISFWSGIIAALGAGLTLLTIWVPQMVMLYIAGILIGLGTGFFMTSNWALGADLVPAEEAGRYLGVSNLA